MEGVWKQPRKRNRKRRRGIRRIAFCPCSIKGEITHLLRFFLKTTALIDQTTWMYRPIFNMKYRHQKSITPVFSLSPHYLQLFVALLAQSLMHLHPCLPCSLCTSPSPLRRPWISHYLCLTCTLCYPLVHLLDKWESRSYSIII